MRNVNISHLLERARRGDARAIEQIVDRLEPLLRKYSSQLGYDDARSELVEWLLKAIHAYPLASRDRDVDLMGYQNSRKTPL